MDRRGKRKGFAHLSIIILFICRAAHKMFGVVGEPIGLLLSSNFPFLVGHQGILTPPCSDIYEEELRKHKREAIKQNVKNKATYVNKMVFRLVLKTNRTKHLLS